MIGTRTPFRMSFIGGGSDLKEFYSITPGCVISTTINKYMYIFIHKYFDDRIHVKYSKTELVETIEKIKHPIVREALKKFNLNGIDINSIGDIPAGTGLGSSSSYTVGLLHSLYTYIDKTVSKEVLANEACELEIKRLKEPIGKQDQYSASYGGLNIIKFNIDGKVDVKPLLLNPEVYNCLQNNLLLFYTGVSRNASDVLYDQRKNMQNDKGKFDCLIRMTELVEESASHLKNENLESFAETLDKNWNLKRSLSGKITNSQIDQIYDLAKKNGAIGGKLLGAGGGGFFVFYCNPNKKNRLRSALKKLREIEFLFDNHGTKVLNINN